MVVNTKTPDLDKPPGQNMQYKPSQELDAIDGNGLFDGPVPIILCQEGYPATGNIQDALVGNGYPVGVLAQVPDHVLSACQGRFAVNHPFGLIRCLQVLVEQGKFVLLSQSAFKTVQEPAFKSSA